MSFQEHDVVELTRSHPELGLVLGMRGAVVYLYQDGQAAEVEFPFPDKVIVATVNLKDLAHVQDPFDDEATDQYPAWPARLTKWLIPIMVLLVVATLGANIFAWIAKPVTTEQTSTKCE